MSKSKEKLELEQISSEKEDAQTPSRDIKLHTYPADFTLEVLNKKLEDEEIKIPDFQRKYVWDFNRASRLIESFLLGLPIPQIYLFVDNEGKLLMVDGQQRAKTIKYFFKGTFEGDTKRVFRLKIDPKSKFNNKTYEDFNEKEKREFKNNTLRSIIIQPFNDKEDYDEILASIFERLNTGGILLGNQEIRNCIYAGGMINFLQELNKEPEWRKILGTNLLDKHQRDVELILRFIALSRTLGSDGELSKYKTPMKKFLSDFLKENRNPNDSELLEIKKVFLNTIKKILQTLGEKPFHIRNGMNAAAFDSVSLVFSRNLNKIPDDVAVRYGKLTKDKQFKEFTEKHTTDKTAIEKRITRAKDILLA